MAWSAPFWDARRRFGLGYQRVESLKSNDMKTFNITCQFPEPYNAQPMGTSGEMNVLTEGGPRLAKITGRMNQVGDRKWEVELEYDETTGGE